MPEKELRKYIQTHDCGKEDEERADKMRQSLIRRLRKKTILGLKIVGARMGKEHPDYAQKVYQRWSEMLVFIESSAAWEGKS